MEQEQTNTPYLERSLDELRRDINLNAEKLFVKPSKTGKICWAILVLSLVVFEFLNLHYKWVVTNWWMLVAANCAIVLMLFTFYIIKKRYFDAMKRAGDAKQHLIATKKLIRCEKCESIIGFILGWLSCSVVIGGKLFDEGKMLFLPFLIIGYAIGVFLPSRPPRVSFFKRYWDFYDDLDELSMYVD